MTVYRIAKDGRKWQVLSAVWSQAAWDQRPVPIPDVKPWHVASRGFRTRREAETWERNERGYALLRRSYE